jgi:phosphate transport system protein
MNEAIHLSSKFDEDLERLRSNVLQMGGLVESQISSITKAYANNSSVNVLSVIENDREVNAMEKAIDDDCVHIIAQRQPTASDLRLIMGISKMVTDLERSGDEIKKMAKSIRRIQSADTSSHNELAVLKGATDIRNLSKAATTQLRRALDTFARLDAVEAAAVIAADEELDAEFKGIVRKLITYMMEDPRAITTALDVMVISRAIERVGDHAKNIAEQVIYIAEGRDVRHTKGDTAS